MQKPDFFDTRFLQKIELLRVNKGEWHDLIDLLTTSGLMRILKGAEHLEMYEICAYMREALNERAP